MTGNGLWRACLLVVCLAGISCADDGKPGIEQGEALPDPTAGISDTDLPEDEPQTSGQSDASEDPEASSGASEPTASSEPDAAPALPTTDSDPPQPATDETGLRLVFPGFVDAQAPPWPYRGLVQLWYVPYPSDNPVGWVLRYGDWETAAGVRNDEQMSQVPLRGLEIDCVGQVALVVHGERGLELGGKSDAVNVSYWVPWGGAAEPVDAPSAELLEALNTSPSNVDVHTEGDLVHVDTGSQRQTYSMRDPVRLDGERWRAQARHDGELFVLTVHPAHLPCYSGISWLSLADTGELVACGANTAATTFVAPEPPEADPVLPDPEEIGTYLSCATQLDLRLVEFESTRPLP